MVADSVIGLQRSDAFQKITPPPILLPPDMTAVVSRLPNYVKPFTDRVSIVSFLFSEITFTLPKQSRKK